MFFKQLPIPDHELGKAFKPFDLVIAAEYGGLKDPENCLPHASKRAVTLAAQAVFNQLAKEITWGNSERPGPGAEAIHQAKLQLLREYNVPPEKVVSVTSNNTIQEIRGIHQARPDAQRILVFCDKPHAKRYRKLVEHYYPKAHIEVRTFEAKWNENHPSFWQKSARRWKIMNSIYLFLMKIIPMNVFIRIFENQTHTISSTKS